MVTVALAIPMTSQGRDWKDYQESLFMRMFFVSFLITHTYGYKYKFYLGVDGDDPLFARKDQQESIIKQITIYSHLSVEFIIFDDITKGHLTKMWNRLAKKAYEDGYEYIYLCGDNILLTHPGWVKEAIRLLRNHDDIGLTGPTNKNGNTKILTQAFISRKHLDIFGYAFPEDIWNYYCDDWINLVYTPDYYYPMLDYHCYNGGGLERYQPIEARDLCHYLAEKDRKKVEEYVKAI